jgi:hypothetical protein
LEVRQPASFSIMLHITDLVFHFTQDAKDFLPLSSEAHGSAGEQTPYTRAHFFLNVSVVRWRASLTFPAMTCAMLNCGVLLSAAVGQDAGRGVHAGGLRHSSFLGAQRVIRLGCFCRLAIASLVAWAVRRHPLSGSVQQPRSFK